MTETIKEERETLPHAIDKTDVEPLSYRQVEALLRHTAVSDSMGVQITTQLKRVAVAIGVLSGRAMGVHDFVYRFDRRTEGNRRVLFMWIHCERNTLHPCAQMALELTPEGYVYRVSDLEIRHSSLPLSASK